MHSGLVIHLFLLFGIFCGVESALGLEERHGAEHVARQGPTSTPTSSKPATTSPILLFDTIPTFTSCSSGSISWLYAGPTDTMSLEVTNIGVEQQDPPASSSSTSAHAIPFTNQGIVAAVPTGASIPKVQAVDFTISTSIIPTSGSFLWNTVNISQGWYILSASIPTSLFSKQSVPFFVQQGSDASCLSGSTSQGPTSTGPSSSTTSSSTIPTNSSGSIAAPVGGASSSSKVGVIVGVVIGGVALLSAVILAYFCLQRKGKGSTLKNGGSAVSRGWGGLGSTDTNHSNKGRGNTKVYAGGRTQRSSSRADSLGPIVTGSEEAFSPSVEKFSLTSTPGHGQSVVASPFDDSAGVVLSNYPALSRNGSIGTNKPGAGRTYSYSSYTTNDYTTTASSSRRPSMPESVNYPVGTSRPSLDSNTYPPPSTAYPSGTSAALSPSITAQTQYYNPYINSELARSQALTLSSTSNVQVSSSQVQYVSPPRNANSPGTTTSRKTPRKPVPVYDPSCASVQQSTVSLPASVYYERSPTESAVGHEIFNVAGGSQGHYTTRTNSQPGVLREPVLQHKSSFGPGGVEGKPLHYLIPDMPLDMKD